VALDVCKYLCNELEAEKWKKIDTDISVAPAIVPPHHNQTTASASKESVSSTSGKVALPSSIRNADVVFIGLRALLDVNKIAALALQAHSANAKRTIHFLVPELVDYIILIVAVSRHRYTYSVL
jgi:hypothetical protein